MAERSIYQLSYGSLAERLAFRAVNRGSEFCSCPTDMYGVLKQLTLPSLEGDTILHKLKLQAHKNGKYDIPLYGTSMELYIDENEGIVHGKIPLSQLPEDQKMRAIKASKEYFRTIAHTTGNVGTDVEPAAHVYGESCYLYPKTRMAQILANMIGLNPNLDDGWLHTGNRVMIEGQVSVNEKNASNPIKLCYGAHLRFPHNIQMQYVNR